jgi:hypothetical protein
MLKKIMDRRTQIQPPESDDWSEASSVSIFKSTSNVHAAVGEATLRSDDVRQIREIFHFSNIKWTSHTLSDCDRPQRLSC